VQAAAPALARVRRSRCEVGTTRISAGLGFLWFSIIALPPWLERGPTSDHASRMRHPVAKTGQASHRPVATGDGVLLRASIFAPCFGLPHMPAAAQGSRLHPEPGPADAPARVAAGQARSGSTSLAVILADFCGSRVHLAFSCHRGAGPSKASAVAEAKVTER
jgi:hypothetical protein